MSNDGQTSGRSAAFTALSGGWLATGGPMVMVVMAATLVFSTLLSPPSSSPASKPEDTKKDGSADPSSPSIDGGAANRDAEVTASLRPLWAHLGIDPIDRRTDQSGKPVAQGPKTAGRPDGGDRSDLPLKTLGDKEFQKEIARLDVQVLIATLPDPVETGSKYEFDMGLEAIQKAIESEGYLIDHFSNPWGNPGSKPGESGAARRPSDDNRLASFFAWETTRSLTARVTTS